MQALLPHQLHIWLTDLRSPFGPPSSLLSNNELAHAQKISRPQAQERYLQVRAEVRRCLANYTGVAPQDLVFDRTPTGKPVLKNAPHPLSFNISHSGDYLVLAVCAGQALGIDLEQVNERRNWRAIAERYFHPDEIAQLLALPEAEQCANFYYRWTLKEAFFKALGTGIATGLDKAAFNLDKAAIRCRFASSLNEQPDAWQFQLWQWKQNYHLALAWKEAATDTSEITFFQGGITGAQLLDVQPTVIAGSRPAHLLDTW